MIFKIKNKKQKNRNFFIDNFFPKNHKGVMSEFMKILLWVVVFILLSVAVSYALNRIIN